MDIDPAKVAALSAACSAIAAIASLLTARRNLLESYRPLVVPRGIELVERNGDLVVRVRTVANLGKGHASYVTVSVHYGIRMSRLLWTFWFGAKMNAYLVVPEEYLEPSATLQLPPDTIHDFCGSLRKCAHLSLVLVRLEYDDVLGHRYTNDLYFTLDLESPRLVPCFGTLRYRKGFRRKLAISRSALQFEVMQYRKKVGEQ